jgi:hypothetical protein
VTPSGLMGPALAASAGMDAMPTELSVVTIGGISLLSVLVTVIRRRAATRRSRAIVVARLATLVAPRSRPRPASRT